MTIEKIETLVSYCERYLPEIPSDIGDALRRYLNNPALYDNTSLLQRTKVQIGKIQ